MPAELTQTEEAGHKKGAEIRFEHVTFRYPDAEEDVLTDIDFTAKPGETTAIIGATGCGKTTLEKKLAKKMNRTFIDLDDEFTKEYSATPAQIITQKGEDTFRTMETTLAKKILPQSGLVIATGGGIVTRKENWFYLRANSRVVYIERPLGFLLKQKTDNRPLSQNNAIQDLYKKRTPLYEEVCDEKWENPSADSGTPSSVYV